MVVPMMKKFFFAFVLLLVGCTGAILFYELPQTLESQFDHTLVSIKKLNDEDIHDDFSNHQDLKFLLSAARNKKIVLLGETHFFAKVQHVINRIVFLLKQQADFSYVSLEEPFSISPFINYYVNITDDDEAANFFSSKHRYMILTEQHKKFLDHVRMWNKRNPSNKIKVGAHDIEYKRRDTYEALLLPYFKPLFDIDTIDKIKAAKLEEKWELMLALMPDVRKKNPAGEFSFITPDYIEAVLMNLEATEKAKSKHFFSHRQNAIIRNLTNENGLGAYFEKGKAILHGGGVHMRTKNVKRRKNFYWEGDFLNNVHEPTKNCCLSISIQGLAYGFADVINLDEKNNLSRSGFYNQALRSFKSKYKDDPNMYHRYFSFEKFDDFSKLLFIKAQASDANVFWAIKIDKNGLLQEFKTKRIPHYPSINSDLQYLSQFDFNIFVARSSIWKAVEKNDGR